jgi:hypothetical protein
MESQFAAASAARSRFCAEVPVTCIPANYRRKRLPRQARLCYVEEPVWDETDQGYVTRIGSTPQAVACARPVRLSVEEAEMIFQALSNPASDEPPVHAAPSYLLPEAVRVLDSSRSYDLDGEVAQTMRSHALTSLPSEAEADDAGSEATAPLEDVSLPCRLYDSWFVAPTSVTDNEGRCLVTVAPLCHRLSGHSSGLVYTVWLDAATLEQAMPVDERFDRLDCYEQRVQVNRFALEHGAVPPPEEPEPVRRGEAAFTATALAEQYQLVPLKDPIYLRKEDVLASVETNPSLLDTQSILSNAIAQVQREQASLAVLPRRESGEVRRLALLSRCLEETLNWYCQLPRHRRGVRILSLSPVHHDENGDEEKAGQGHRCRQQRRCIMLVVGIPTTLPLPWARLADAFSWPQGPQARSGPQAAGAGARIVA